MSDERTDGGREDRRTTRPPATDDRFSVTLRGVAVDPETRCGHYDDPVDVIAFRFPCCGAYYPCFSCHEAVTDHDAERMPRSAFEEPGVLCGVCGTTLSVETYLDCDDVCPDCGARFNPGCRCHHDRYLEV